MAPCRGFRRTHRPTRRHALAAGALAPFGLGLPTLLARDSAGPAPRAKACIVLFMWGGPSHLDTWDPKPDAPPEVRGEFGSVATSTPGLRIGEHFPRLAGLAHRYAVVRSLSHTDPAHLSPVHHLFTGRVAAVPNSDAAPATRKDAPHLGAVLAKLRPAAAGVPTAVTLPWQVSHPSAPGGTAPGQHAGWLGAGFDPFVATGNPNAPGFGVAGLGAAGDLAARADLLRALDARGADPAHFAPVRAKALDLLTSGTVAAAFDLNRESPRTRDRYGRHPHGQSCLLARRLVEAGTKLVCVNWPDDGQSFWDTHANNFSSLKTRLMPPADAGFAALLEDLAARGLLDETLVVWVGEFGRRPTVSPGGGREHWPGCYSAVLAGAGVRGGLVYGSSDRLAARPAANAASPADLTATIYHALGLDPDALLPDRLGRPLPLADGKPLTGLFG